MPIALKDDKFRIDVGSGPEKEFRESSRYLKCLRLPKDSSKSPLSF
ncbi:hypothetical protein WN944_020120 [Citrus x changshan-huyou]|uniref:Uncharacterized protein n=1 Tax=Citrus x changshan-huyou TaxID=2935761 RepID=A0AAP0LWQ5_9ROSI